MEVLKIEVQLISSDLSITRQSSNNSTCGFRLHKDASIKDAQEFISLFNFNFDTSRLETTQSRVKSYEKKSSPDDTDTGSLSQADTRDIACLAMEMIENNKLVVSRYGELSEFDRRYLANVIYIRNKAHIDTSLSNQEFVKLINSNLGQIKEKRNDDRLRFIYKRAIKYLLAKTSNYTANKLHKMDNFKDRLIAYYFPDLVDNKLVENDLMDTSFASKKKLLKLFRLSSSFKYDFLNFAKFQIQDIYKKYTTETYQSMYKHLRLKHIKTESRELEIDTLFKNFKRLPWRFSDIQSTVEQLTVFKQV